MEKRAEKKARKPSQQRAVATVEAILEATARILEREGLGRGLGTNRIAREAGVSVGSLYEYFEGKDAIVQALCERHVQQVRFLVDQTFENLRDAPLEPAVDYFIDALFLLHEARPELQRVLNLEFPRRFGLDPFIQNDQYTEAKLVDWLVARYPSTPRHDLQARAFIAVRTGRTITIHTFAEGLPDERKTHVRSALKGTLIQLLDLSATPQDFGG